MSRIEDLILSDVETTFQYDTDLPALPTPDLESTLKRYLESVKVVVSDEEYRQTEFLVQQFASGEGKYLQQKLREKASSTRNWLAQWWEDVAYLEIRAPLPLMNMGGPGPYGDDVWPPKAGTQLMRASMLTHYTLKLWQYIRREQYRPMKDSRGKPLCMFQFRRIFNTCRIPGVFRDKLTNYFQTASVGDCPSHIVVMCQSHLFLVNTLDEAGEILTPPEIELQLKRIRDKAQSLAPSDGINFLASLPRDRWAEARNHLIALHPQNFEIFEKIQSSVVVLGLDDIDGGNLNQLGFKALLGDIDNRWCDKSLTIGVYRDGTTVSCSDHTPAEGLMMVFITTYVYNKIKEGNGEWKGTKVIRPQPEPQHLKFVVDSKIEKEVQVAKKLFKEIQGIAMSHIEEYSKYGKAFCKKIKVHPDTYCQLAMQLAYYTIYKRMAPTYETASIKNFYHGRTETVRSCTSEGHSWCKAMVDPSSSVAERCRLFMAAVNKQNTLMAEATAFKGCDRHLLGLYMVAREEERPLHAFFTDPAFFKSGGGGNYILSTSCIGYSNVLGAVLPMCKDSIGCFYRINDDKLSFYITTWNADKDTDCRHFGEVVSRTLDGMQQLAIQGAALSNARL